MVCASAFHVGAISEKGGDFELRIDEALKAYVEKKQNSVASQKREGNPGPYSVSFIGTKKSGFVPFVGQLVDVEVGQKWKEGIVKVVKKVSNEFYDLEILVNGEKNQNIRWPNTKLAFCSKKIHKRVCEKKSLEPSLADAFKANICFSLR
jgi:hypothetical protein